MKFTFLSLLSLYFKMLYFCFQDLGRMYNLTSRVPDALGMLKQLLEEHIYSQGLSTIEKCGEAAINVCIIYIYAWFQIKYNLEIMVTSKLKFHITFIRIHDNM